MPRLCRVRWLPALALFFLQVPIAAAQPDLRVLPDQDGTPRKMLYSYLTTEARKHFDARRAAVAALKTPEDVRRRQKELRAKFLAALGGFPERGRLNHRVVGKLACDGYRLERVIYESSPSHYVTAVLYLPDGKPPFPGVLMPCGHSANGKAAEAYQRACILMAKNGLAVLCYDPIGQGERNQLLMPGGKPAIPASTSEHTMVGVGALLVGRNTATYRIWDGIRSLDYLASRLDIDPKRLGCTGNSGGGTMTAYLMALDDRIAAAAPSCYLTTLERLFATIGPQDAEQNITGQVAFGMEHADYVTLRAPKPTLMCVATRDFFDIQGAWTTFREAKLQYGLLGHGERVDLFEFNDTHGFSKPRREAAMRWLRRWLLGIDDAPAEGNFPIHTDAELQCTRFGQVLADHVGDSVFHLNALEEGKAFRARAKRRLSREERLKVIRRLIALPERIPPAGRKEVGEVKRDELVLRKVLFTTEPGIEVPALEAQPSPAAGKQPLVLYVHGEGKSADLGAIATLAKAGHRVLALDLRGTGETAPGVARADRPNYFGTDSKEAFLALHLNRPLLGQRVYDLLAVVGRLRQDGDVDMRVIGVGAAGPVVLHAAAFEPALAQVTLEQSLVAWRMVVRTPISFNQLTNVVPGALLHYDLPELAGLLAPRPLTIQAAVDAQREPVPLETVQQHLAPCIDDYRTQKAAEKLQLR